VSATSARDWRGRIIGNEQAHPSGQRPGPGHNEARRGLVRGRAGQETSFFRHGLNALPGEEERREKLREYRMKAEGALQMLKEMGVENLKLQALVSVYASELKALGKSDDEIRTMADRVGEFSEDQLDDPDDLPGRGAARRRRRRRRRRCWRR